MELPMPMSSTPTFPLPVISKVTPPMKYFWWPILETTRLSSDTGGYSLTIPLSIGELARLPLHDVPLCVSGTTLVIDSRT